MKDCVFTFDPEAEPLVPVMAEQAEACCRRGLILRNVDRVTLEGVRYECVEGPWIETENVNQITEKA